ncbi:BQ5605_C017g08504 [Microbotryum silenes-dioicae]|uniref:BQ5605_C017g08504 protein n=1 Tax=Microbotryum silenes-dioicae TaxID=796604 RepID=A0A2X0LZI9_9BASI|nr:BQ5605_C017g08504 [Microbotryum silenes-dioicae]
MSSGVLTSISRTTSPFSSGFLPSSTTSVNNSNNNNNNNGESTGLGPTIWYYVVALAIVTLLLSTIGSRVFLMRRRRRLYGPDARCSLPRPTGTGGGATTIGSGGRLGGIPTYRPDNGELESGLPTYCETTTYSYTSGLPVGSVAANSTNPFDASRAVPADHPMYAGPTIPVGAFTRNEGGVERSGMGMGLPAYTAPTTTTEGHTNGLTTTGQGNVTLNQVATPEPPKYES